MLQAGYSLLFIVLFSAILWFYNSALKKANIAAQSRKKKLGVIIGITLLWLIYVEVLIICGILLDMSLPPKMPLLIIVPLFLFTGIFLFRKRNHTILQHIPEHLPIAYQSFRAIIELLFYFTFLKGILPVEVTFEGYNYDVLLGLSAPLVALLAYKKRVSKRLLIAWNIVGIIIVGIAAFIFITSFYFPSIWGSSEESLISIEFGQYPFILLPAFFMPSAIFMHVLSIVQLTRKVKNNPANQGHSK